VKTSIIIEPENYLFFFNKAKLLLQWWELNTQIQDRMQRDLGCVCLEIDPSAVIPIRRFPPSALSLPI